MAERLVDAGGTSLHVCDWGEPNRPGVFCWHMLGPAQGAHRFAGLARTLVADHALRVVALDGPGFGGSPALEPLERYRPSQLTDLAAHVLNAYGLPAADFVGASWGATVGCAFALRHPTRVRRLALLDIGYQDPLPRKPLDEWIGIAAERDDGVPAEVRGAVLWGAAQEPPTAAALATLQMPLLVLTATEPLEEEPERSAAIAAFRRVVPNAEVHAVRGASHDLLGDAEATVTELLSAWLRAAAS